MNKNRRNWLGMVCVAMIVCLSSMRAEAAQISEIDLQNLNIADESAPIVLGQWHYGWAKCKAYAEANDIPMFAVWGRVMCDHCYRLDVAFETETFKQFLATNPKGQVVLCFMCGDSEQLGIGLPDQMYSEAYYWMWHNQSLGMFPFTCFYWPSHGVSQFQTGDELRGDYYASAETSANAIIAAFERYFAEWNNGPKYSGGVFSVGTNEYDRLEAEIDKTVYVDVPLVRTNAVDMAGTNGFAVAWKGNPVMDEAVVWAAGEESKMVRVTVPTGVAAGDVLSLALKNDSGETVEESAIFCVAAQPNSSRNPLWIGQRTLSGTRGATAALDYGEWTMDYVLATDKVARAEGPAGTLVFFTGALWCPHCKGLDKCVLDTEEFRTFAKANNLALVALDNPRRSAADNQSTGATSPVPNGKPPTLLRYATGIANTSTGRLGSGASYLSRNMIPVEEAESVLLRNHTLGYKDTLNGGLKAIGGFRTGYPSILLLRKDGKVAGRMAYIEETTTTDEIGDTVGVWDKTATMKRLEELVALAAADDTEETNGYVETTGLELPVQTTTPTSGTLDANDRTDIYRIPGASNMRVEAVLGLPHGAQDASVKMRFVEVLKGAGGESVETTGRLSAGVSASYPCGGGELYLVVEADVSTNAPAAFDIRSRENTTRGYTVETHRLIEPNAEGVVQELSAETTSVWLYVESGRTYRLTVSQNGSALGLGYPDGAFTIVKGLYCANVSGGVQITIPEGDATGAKLLDFRVWDAGSIGFAAPSMVVEEECEGASSKTVTFNVVRLGGASGEAGGVVTFLAAESEARIEDGRFAFGTGWSPSVVANGVTNWTANVSWRNGDSAARSLSFTLFDDTSADGNQKMVFSFTRSADTIASVTNAMLEVTLVENDKPRVGKLAITGANPAFAKTMYVVAEENSTVTFTVSRDGTDTDVSAYLSLSIAGEELARSETMTWENRTRNPQRSATLNMPSAPDGAKAVVTLVPITPTVAVDSTARAVTVQIVSDKAPVFEPDAIYMTNLITRVQSEGAGATLMNLQYGDEVSIVKTRGTLLSGMESMKEQWATAPVGTNVVASAVFTSMNFYGVPSAAGDSEAVYQAVVVRNGKTILGGTLTVRMSAVALAEATETCKENVETGGVLAKMRTYSGIPVSEAAESSVFPEMTGRMFGLLTLTLPPSGRASAKLQTADKTYSYMASSWTGIGANGLPEVKLNGLSGGGTMMVTPRVDGGASVTIDYTDCCGYYSRVLTAEMDDTEWSSANPATEYVGIYTVQLPQEDVDRGSEIYPLGDAGLSLRITDAMTRSGRVMYSGFLPDGRSVSGTATLLPCGERTDYNGGTFRYASIPFFKGARNSYLFSGCLDLLAGAARSYTAHRRSVYPSPGCWPRWEVSGAMPHAANLGVYGAYFDGTITKCCQDDFGQTQIGFFTSTELIESKIYGDGGIVTNVVVSAEDDNLVVADAGNVMLRLSYSKTTGFASGTFLLPFSGGSVVAVTWRGIVLPGWASCGDCSPDVSLVPRPLVSGACWFTDRIEIGDGARPSFKNGVPVLIGLPSYE